MSFDISRLTDHSSLRGYDIIVIWKPLQGQDRLLPSVKVVYPYDQIEWNRFDTQICLGEYHKDSCSKTGQIIKVDYKKYGLYGGVPLLALILTIILVCVCVKKRKRERKFKAWNKLFESHPFP